MCHALEQSLLCYGARRLSFVSMIRFLLLLVLTTTRLCAQLNSSFDEQSPVLTPDGMELYFTIAHHPLNNAGKRDLGDVWVSQLLDGKWSLPNLASGLLNNSGYNAVLGFSRDGQEMFLYGHYNANGSAAGSQGISVSTKTAGGWSLPRNEEVPYFLNKSVGTGGYIDPDKTIFIFSAESRGSYGHEDIYVSISNGLGWTEPKNIGPAINSRRQELTPWLSADTRTLYFASNMESSLGSYDIYSSDRLDDTWVNWSKPRNLGQSINSSGKELFYCVFPGNVFYTSTYNSDGYGDIRNIHTIETDFMVNKDSTALEPVKVVQPMIEPTLVRESAKIFGRVTNASNGQGIAAHIVFHSAAINSMISTAAGNYEIHLADKLSYTVRVDAKGYVGLFEKIDLTNQTQPLEINFKLQPVAVGISVNLRSVLFKQSLPDLLPESYDELNMVVEFLKANPTVEIELAGHTDNAGNAKANIKLSRDRAMRIKNYLSEQGIDARRMKGVGYGGSKPIASNKTEEGKKLNRRVEFKIIKE
jgi:OmpA-OmpF porin, OOP family